MLQEGAHEGDDGCFQSEDTDIGNGKTFLHSYIGFIFILSPMILFNDWHPFTLKLSHVFSPEYFWTESL